MKSLSIVALSAAAVLALSLPAFAKEVQGVIDSVDPSTNTVVIEDTMVSSFHAV